MIDPSVFERMTDPLTLTDAWNHIRRKGGGPGGDLMRIEDFEEDWGHRIERLSRELRSDIYRPGPLRSVRARKKSGGFRNLSIPCVVDRVAQRSAAVTLTRLFEPEFEDSSFAYRPGRSAAMAAERVATLRRAGFDHVVDADIEAFFDEIPHDLLLRKLRSELDDFSLVRLIKRWLAGFSERGVGLAQGSPISPVLANLHLDALDEEIAKAGFHLVRFADDFVILCKSAGRAEKALGLAERLLRENGLTLNPEKTQIRRMDDAFVFLGKLFVGSMMLDADAHAEGERGSALLLGPALQDDRVQLHETRRPKLTPHPEPERPFSDENEMLEADDAPQAPIYVFEAGRSVGVDAEGFEILEQDRILARLPVSQITRIDLALGAAIDADALRLAAAHGIPVHFLDGFGGVEAIAHALDDRRGDLHLEQAKIALAEDRCLETARAIVSARLRGEHALLTRLNRRHREQKVADAIDAIFAARRKAEDAATTLEAVRGHEGEGGGVYWRALGRLLLHGFRLPGRTRGDGATPADALMNFAASLLERDVRAAVSRAGLHPGFGTLHATGARRSPLVWDLMEEYRAPLAEAFAVYAMNNRLVSTDDFRAVDGRARMLGGSSARFVRGWEKWVARPQRGRHGGPSWRGAVFAQACAYAAALRAGRIYEPYKMDY